MLICKLGRNGFTLVELLVVLAITSLLVSALASFALAWQANTYRDYKYAELQNDMRYALHVIEYHLRQAQSIAIEKKSDGLQITISKPGKSPVVIAQSKKHRTLWYKSVSLPMCSHIFAFDVDASQLPLVGIKIKSVDKLPGIKRGLPITMSMQVRMRNYDQESWRHAHIKATE